MDADFFDGMDSVFFARSIVILLLCSALAACAAKTATTGAAGENRQSSSESVSAVPLAMSTEQQTRMAQIIQTGLQIYQQDQFAWIATDLLLQRLQTEPDLPNPNGWTVDVDGSDAIVHFYSPSNTDRPRPLMDIVFKDGAEPALRIDQDRTISEEEVAPPPVTA